MNREEMFALARGQSCSLTEMKGKHCIDSLDLFAGEKAHNFGMFTRLKTTNLDQRCNCIYRTCIANCCTFNTATATSHVEHPLRYLISTLSAG